MTTRVWFGGSTADWSAAPSRADLEQAVEITDCLDLRLTSYLESTELRDGTVIVGFDGSGDDEAVCVMIGTRPLSDVELAGEEGRHLARVGLADVLAWLGEEVGEAPVRCGRGAALLAKHDVTRRFWLNDWVRGS